MRIEFEEKFKEMLPALTSKMNEFHMYGYPTVTVQEIWEYCLKKRWRNLDVTSMKNHKLVNDILQILPAAFMTYTQIEAQRNTDWFSDLNADELKLLLDPQSDKKD